MRIGASLSAAWDSLLCTAVLAYSGGLDTCQVSLLMRGDAGCLWTAEVSASSTLCGAQHEP